MQDGPDFVCIGAPKTGTTWLYRNLRIHPEVILPPEKEVNFFYPEIPPDIDVQDLKITQRKLELTGIWGDWWRTRYIRWHDAKTQGDLSFPLTWYERNLFAPRLGAEYVKLFPKTDGKITGDISPNYAIMDEDKIREMASACPKTKIIYFLRNPIERAWSDFRFEEKGKWVKSDLEHTEILAEMQIRANSYKNHGNYAEKIMLWEKYFPGRIYVYFYDDLEHNPIAHFKRICKMLGISPKPISEKLLLGKIIAATPYDMPANIKTWLTDLLMPECRAIHAHFKNNHTKRWLTGKPKPPPNKYMLFMKRVARFAKRKAFGIINYARSAS